MTEPRRVWRTRGVRPDSPRGASRGGESPLDKPGKALYNASENHDARHQPIDGEIPQAVGVV